MITDDYSISLQQIELLAPRISTGIRIILVISGEITVETNSRYYPLKENDLLVINRNQFFQVKGSKKNSVLMLNISDMYLSKAYSSYRTSRFECYSREIDMGRESMVGKLRKLLVELMLTYYRRDESYQIEIQAFISELLLILIRRFKQKGSSNEKIDTQDERLTQIIAYMEKNYDQSITLEEIANSFYLSSGYLSRYFKQKVGTGFNRFLMNIRLEHSLKDLMYTSNSISQIAMKNGFPNTKSFTTLFKEIYEDTPKNYREKHKVESVDSVKRYNLEDASEIIHSPSILERLGAILTNSDETYNNTETKSEELKLDLSHVSTNKIKRPMHNLMIGELRELLKESVRSQILMVAKDMRLENIGVRNLIKGSTFIPPVETDEIISTTSPYYNADFALNFLKKHELSLFVRVDYKEISTDEESYFTELHNFMRHCINVYGKAYIETWHFMFYESFPTGVDGKELERVYKKLYYALKAFVPLISVGSFFPFAFKKEVTSTQHKWLIKDDIPVDFFGYEANQNEVINFEELGDDRFSLAEGYIKEKTDKLLSYLLHHKKERPIHLISWNTLSGNTRHTNGTFFRGALVLKNAFEVADKVESMGFWINTEQHEKGRKERNIPIEGLELFHYFNGKRPAYFAMQFLERLQGEIIVSGSDYIMTKNDRGYQLLLMNSNIINPYYSVEDTFLQKLNKDIHVAISNMEQGDYQIRKHVFDKNNGALYTKWWELNSAYGMDMEVIDYIIQTSRPSIEIFDEAIEGEWSFYSYLSINAIHFFDIRKALD
ncbi:helix-turn-helix domain-containing protein [Oceanobacillus chungangensis]|uniref:Beta-xylosidase n=1 Tax=Oceanobacillus chungangensis TaxID=1229152 RepID=A0A3D8PJG7_9BACI|nr:helix-turn-helix domain-containing protein [Oceanobacillus chungangensis]RDW16240.1 beta-xylosidase [Oceanobacillus chungangensis]